MRIRCIRRPSSSRAWPSSLSKHPNTLYPGVVQSVRNMCRSGGRTRFVHKTRPYHSIGDFRSDGEYIPYGAGDSTEDEQRIFRQWGPLNMSFDVRDLAVYPDTSRSAEGMRAIWQRTPWGSNTQLDGVLMVDPVFLQELTKISGNVTIPDGTVLTGDNTAEFLLNKVYIDYPVSMQDALFAQVAEQTVGSMFSNVDLTKLTKVAQLMGSMAEGRHFSMYAFDETAEKPLVMQALPRRRQAARKTRRWECM